MRTWVLVVAIQIAALAVLANRFRQKESHQSSKTHICGLLNASEYIITSRNVVLPDGMQPAAGSASQANLTAAAALKFGLKTILDYGDLVVAPGLIDTHVHLNEPGRENWEGFLSGTKAAAAGGTTSTILMPLNALPAIVSAELLQKMILASKNQLWVDVGYWGGLVPQNAGNHSILQGLLDAGALGFKSFMSPAGIDDFDNVLEDDIAAALPFLKEQGIPYYIHAELPDETVFQGDVRNHANWERARPPQWERNAIKLLLNLIRRDRTPAHPGFTLHIAHMSDTGSLEGIARAKKDGLPISVETCPHYLNFASEEVPSGATLYKCAPPIRSSANREAIWQGLVDGVVDSIASDHSPCPRDMKLLEEGDFSSAWGGISGLQYNLPSTWDGMKKRQLGPELLTKWWSEAPAKLAGLSRQKGSIEEGFDADLMVWDPFQLADTTISAVQHKHKLSPYNDKTLVGRVVATFIRGHQIFANASTLASLPCGRTILRGSVH